MLRLQNPYYRRPGHLPLLHLGLVWLICISVTGANAGCGDDAEQEIVVQPEINLFSPVFQEEVSLAVADKDLTKEQATERLRQWENEELTEAERWLWELIIAGIVGGPEVFPAADEQQEPPPPPPQLSQKPPEPQDPLEEPDKPTATSEPASRPDKSFLVYYSTPRELLPPGVTPKKIAVWNFGNIHAVQYSASRTHFEIVGRVYGDSIANFITDYTLAWVKVDPQTGEIQEIKLNTEYSDMVPQDQLRQLLVDNGLPETIVDMSNPSYSLAETFFVHPAEDNPRPPPGSALSTVHRKEEYFPRKVN